MRVRRPGWWLAVVAIPAVVGLAVWSWQATNEKVGDATSAFGLLPLQLSEGVALDRSRIELGRKLFFDRRLSFNGTMSCAMCHVPEEGFTSHASQTAMGIEGKSLRRNSPTLLNVAWQASLFHDGRESSLTTQAWMPLPHPDEMANPSIGHVLQRLRGMADYVSQFERAFRGAAPSMETLGAAIAAFEATLVAADSRFDRWRYGGPNGGANGSQSSALSEVEQLGFRIFSGKGRCTFCHLVGEQHALLSDGKFHVIGAGLALPDPADRYAFKTPSLRNVAHTAPYMHDGSLATLEAVIDFYDRGGGDAPDKSEVLAALGLGSDEKHALVAFLRTLDGASLPALSSTSRPLNLP